MIVKTMPLPLGAYLPIIRAQDSAPYEMKPNELMTDTRGEQLSRGFADALVDHTNEQWSDGAKFIDLARDVATWNVEPRAHYAQVYDPRAHLGPLEKPKGRTIDTFA